MANRVFIIPRRNDLAGLNLCLHDLKPNAGQKNGVYDGTHQNVYIAEMLDRTGATVVNGNQFVSGSLHTGMAIEAGQNDVDDDTTGGGNDVSATQRVAFGLAAYLFDRVDPGAAAGAAGTNPMTVANADAMAQALLVIAEAGGALTLAAINVSLSTVVANTDLDGTAHANSDSFGSVADILRILAGEVYRLPALTILGDVSTGTGDFLSLAARQVLVDAQTPAQVLAQGQFSSSGAFLTSVDAGHRPRPTLVRSGAVNVSNALGQINGYKQNVEVLNRNFAYAAADVTTLRPRAFDVGGTAIATTGLHPAIGVYDQDGNAL